MEKIHTVDLHAVFTDGKQIAKQLGAAITAAKRCNCTILEVVHGKGSGALRRTVTRFFDQPHIKDQIKSVRHDAHNRGHVFIDL